MNKLDLNSPKVTNLSESNETSRPLFTPKPRLYTPPTQWGLILQTYPNNIKEAIKRLYDHLDRKNVVCSLTKDLKKSIKVEYCPDNVFGFPYIQYNPWYLTKYIIIDVDLPVASSIAHGIKYLLPLPTFWIANGRKSSHLVYELDSCWSGKGLTQVRAITTLLIHAWNADRAITGKLLGKSPLSNEWALTPSQSSGTAYNLSSLKQMLLQARETGAFKPKVIEHCTNSRNQHMFDTLRKEAYILALSGNKAQDITIELTNIANEIKQEIIDSHVKKELYTDSEINNTIQSIVRYVTTQSKEKLEQLIGSKQSKNVNIAYKQRDRMLRYGFMLLMGSSKKQAERGSGLDASNYGTYYPDIHTKFTPPSWAPPSGNTSIVISSKKVTVTICVEKTGIYAKSEFHKLPHLNSKMLIFSLAINTPVNTDSDDLNVDLLSNTDDSFDFGYNTVTKEQQHTVYLNANGHRINPSTTQATIPLPTNEPPLNRIIEQNTQFLKDLPYIDDIF